MDGTSLTNYVPDLVERIRRLDPEKIILIKASVHDAAYRPGSRGRLSCSFRACAVPGSGQQKRFEEAFGRALEIGLA